VCATSEQSHEVTERPNVAETDHSVDSNNQILKSNFWEISQS